MRDRAKRGTKNYFKFNSYKQDYIQTIHQNQIAGAEFPAFIE